MVDRVGNGPGYNYPQINERKVNSGANGTGEKFQLDYGKEGAIYEPSNEALKKQQDEKKVATRPQDIPEEDGVRLTLSSATLKQEEHATSTDNTQSGSLIDVVTDIVNKVIEAVKGFFSSIWNDAPDTPGEIKEQFGAGEISEKPKTQFEKAKAEAEVFLASTEGKKVARNSDLLTYYDKHGTVVNVSPSDRQRILYGDKNQIEV